MACEISLPLWEFHERSSENSQIVVNLSSLRLIMMGKEKGLHTIPEKDRPREERKKERKEWRGRAGYSLSSFNGGSEVDESATILVCCTYHPRGAAH